MVTKAEDVLIDDGSPTAYSLAVLLIRKTLFSDDWEESWDSILDGLREDATTQGVHPVWSKMAEATPILAQFAAFPQSEIKEQEADKFDTINSENRPSKWQITGKCALNIRGDIV